MGVIKSTFQGARKTYGWLQNLIFYVVTAGLGVAGANVITVGELFESESEE